MQFDFPTILFFAALATGVIWLLDHWLWKPKRMSQMTDPEQVKEPLIVEYSRSFFPIILVVLILRSFIVEPFRIPSGSMMPTLLAGDFILVNKFSYGIRLPVINRKVLDLGSPRHGDVVVFRYPIQPSVDYIKRVIGIPGDRIDYKGKMLYINGTPLDYQKNGMYVGQGAGVSMTGTQVVKEKIGEVEHDILVRPNELDYAYKCLQDNTTFVVPPNHYFVMGDNRDHSNDSRFWCAVPDENLVGKAFLVWMHWDSEGNGLDTSRIGRSIQ